ERELSQQGNERCTMWCRLFVLYTPRVVCGMQACNNHPCTEVIVASRRITTIQQCRVPLETAERVDDALPSCRTGDDRDEPSPAPVGRGAEPAPQRCSAGWVVVDGGPRGLLSVGSSCLGFSGDGGYNRDVAKQCKGYETEGTDTWSTKAEGFFWCTSISTPSTTRNSTSGITPNICQNCWPCPAFFRRPGTRQ